MRGRGHTELGGGRSYLCVSPSVAPPRCVAALSAWPPAGGAPLWRRHTLWLQADRHPEVRVVVVVMSVTLPVVKRTDGGGDHYRKHCLISVVSVLTVKRAMEWVQPDAATVIQHKVVFQLVTLANKANISFRSNY